MPIPRPIDVARLEEARCATAISEIASESAPFAGGHMCYDVPGSWANFALGMAFDHEFTGADFDALHDYYGARDASPRIGVTAFHHPSLIERARERNFTLREFESVFAADLATRETLAEPYDEPSGLEIITVDPSDDDEVTRFARLATSGFIGEGEDPDLHVPIAIEAARHPRALNFIATIDGEPAGAGSMEFAGELAALYGVTTLEPFRKRRLQRALIEHRLREAEARGCRIATIASKPGVATERNAMRAGFAPSYTHVQLAAPGGKDTPTQSHDSGG